MDLLATLIADFITFLSYSIIFLALALTFPFLIKFLIEYYINRRDFQKRLEEKDKYLLLMLRIPKNNQEKEKTFEKLLSSIHAVLIPYKEWIKTGPRQKDLSLEIVSFEKNIHFFLWVNKEYEKLIEGQIYAQFPDIEIEAVEDYSKRDLPFAGFAGSQILLTKRDSLAIKTFNNFEGDSLAVLSGTLTASLDKNDEVWAQLLLRPVARAGFYKNLGKIWESVLKQSVSRKDETLSSPLFRCQINVAFFSGQPEPRLKLSQILGYFKQFDGENKFKNRLVDTSVFLEKYRNRALSGGSFLLTASEIASIYHFPYADNRMVGVVKTTTKRAEPPLNLPKEENELRDEISLFGETNFRGEKIKFGIRREDRRRHLYVVGKSGTGKSKLLELLMLEDIKAGKGFGLIDPHGDLSETVIKHLPKDQVEKVVYFNPADEDYPLAFNLLESAYKSEEKQQIVQGFIGIFKKIFTIDFNPRLEHMIRYIILALLESPGSTILGINRLLTDIKYRQKIIANIQDPVVKSFWANEFISYNERYANEAIVPILNKMGQFVANPIIRNIVGQTRNTIDFRHIMDEGKVLIMNLSRGKLGEENSDLLGSMVITKIQQAAISRANVSEEERVDFNLYVDEFQNFATAAFANIFTEARKYRLDLTVAHQYLTQLPPEVKGTVFGNVGSLISFRVGAEDAGFLAAEFAPTFSAEDLIGLDARDLYLKISIKGQTSNAFSAKTIDCPSAPVPNYATEVIDFTRLKYAKPRVSVENEVAKWQNMEEITGEEESFPEPIV
ncbi:MAG: DUF87 domain-containing protein [bacterium]|nr:DUF87 domain-containing protein [bacterium]